MQLPSKTSRGILFILYWIAFWIVAAIVPMAVRDLLLYHILWKQNAITGAIIGGMAGMVGGLAQISTNRVAKGWINDVVCWGMVLTAVGLIIGLVYSSILPPLILAAIGAVGGAVGGLVYPRLDVFRTPHKILAIVLVFGLLAIVIAFVPAYRAML